ncbi:unnamed protein product, partial [Brachionus calyciflorus]
MEPKIQNTNLTDKTLKLPVINNTKHNNIFKIIQNNEPDINKINQLIFKLRSKIENGDSFDGDLNELKTDLIKTVVNTLMTNSDKDWHFLHLYFKSLIPVCKYLENDRRIHHYLNRIQCISTRKGQNKDFLELINLLNNTFPLTKNTQEINYVKAYMDKKDQSKLDFLVPNPIINFYDGKLDPYSNKIKDIKFKPSGGPNLKEINQVLSKVTLSSFKSETNWKEKDSRLVLATSLNLDELDETIVSKPIEKRNLFEYLNHDDDDEIIKLEYIEKKYSHECPDFEEKCINLSGRDMVFYLLKSTHLANAVSFYLNPIESKLYRPYDLITVPKSKAQSEHYIFSVFGVMHLISGEENERLTLDEWNRHAVLWEACSKIKFFKEFLYRKFMYRWRTNSKYSQFLKLKKSISKNIIQSVPFYQEALIHISKLIQSIYNINFYPDFNRDNLIQEKSQLKQKNLFNLDQFLSKIDDLTFKSEEVLEFFFVYVKYVLEHTRHRYFDKLRFYETLVYQAKTTGEMNKSMSIQKDFRTKAEKELANLSHEIGLIGNFTCLVSSMLASNLLQIVKIELIRLLDEFDECLNDKRGPLFYAELGFDNEHKVTMLPNQNTFVNEIMKSIRKMLNAIIYASKIIDFEGTLKDNEKYGYSLINYKIDEDEELSDDLSEKLEDRKTDYYYFKMIDKQRDDLPVKKPILNMTRDYDLNLLDKKLVLKFKEEILKVDNYLIKAQANPLKSISFSSIILNDEILNGHIDRIHKTLIQATEEIQQFCEDNSWLNEIKAYISKWSNKLIYEWKQKGAGEFEEQLGKIRNWTETIKNNFEKILITNNKILKISTSPVEQFLLPKLDSIYVEICECLVTQINSDSLDFIEQINLIIQEIEEKPQNIEDFARYAKKASKYKTDITLNEHKIKLIKSLTEVLRIYYRPLNLEEEQLDTQLQDTWKFFLAKIQETLVFVNTQSPSILDQLETLYNKYLEEIRLIHYTGTTGIYLDPSQDSTKIIEDLKNLCHDLAAVEKILNQCALWREAITEQAEDMSFLTRLSSQLIARKELWKYYQVTYHHIKDWKNTDIKKLPVKKIEEKLAFWEGQAQEIKKTLLDDDDKVWSSWWDLLVTFKMNMTWIDKLASDIFKDEHFQELLAAIGLEYIPKKVYTVQDLIDLKLLDYSDLINQIYKRGWIDSNHIVQFNSIIELWNSKLKYKLAKNFPIKLYKQDKFKLDSLNDKKAKGSKTSRIKELKEMSRKQSDEQMTLLTNVTYKLVDIDEIRFYADDSIIKLDMILESQVNKKIKEDVLELKIKINKILEISELWMEVQQKWLWLEKIYSDTDNFVRPTQDSVSFQSILNEFKDLQCKINNDPYVMNIVKDEFYKNKLTELSNKFSLHCNNFDNIIEQSCHEFPRFYFLEKKKLIETLSQMRDCRKYLETVKLCFSGVKDLAYSLPKDLSGDKPDALALDINASELEVTGITGRNGGEKLLFFTSLKSYSLQKPSEWFDNFSKIMRSSLCRHMHSYLDKLEDHADYQTIVSLDKRLGEIKDIPTQIVILGESLIWCKHVTRIIEHKKIDEFKYIMNYLNNSISKLSSLQVTSLDANERDLYSKLILWLVYAKELTLSLIDVKNLHQFSYEWLRIMKYKYEKRVILKNSEELDPMEISVIMYNKYENVHVNQMTSNIIYDFEFHDLSSQLVLNPLTDKCFLNLTSAISSFRCGTLTGPNATGKRQTLNLLAQNCGQFLMQINCSYELTNELADRMLKGLVYSGCWLLFDHVDKLEKSVLSSIGFQLEYLRSSAKILTEKDNSMNGILDTNMIRQRPLTCQKQNPKLQRVHTVPFYFVNNTGLKTYFEEPYDDEYDNIPTYDDSKGDLRFKEEELKRIEDAINYGPNKPDLHFKRTYLGYIRFMGRIVRINTNLACFMTTRSYEKFPENIKNCTRNVRLIEPDLYQITKALLLSQGFNQGLTDVETLSKKLIDFLTLLPSIISNDFIRKCLNISTISKIIQLSAIKYRQDKGRQERAICLNLACLFGPNFVNPNDKVLFNSLLKKIFDYEPTSFIEETLSNLIKSQMADNGLKINNKQIQKMIDLYTSLRVNQIVILSGPPLDGKTTIWKTLSKAINLLQSRENNNSKSSEVFKKYSILVNFLNDEQRFPDIMTYHTFPGAYKNDNHFSKLIGQCVSSYNSTYNLQKDQSNNKKVNFKQIEKWIVLDSNIDEQTLVEQLALLNGNVEPLSTPNKIPETVKFIIETPNLSNVSPSIISKTMLIIQQDLDWKYVLESKISQVGLKYSVPKSKVSILQEYAIRCFNEIKSRIDLLNFKSIIHGNLPLESISFNSFILLYVNLIDCLLKKFGTELKQSDQDDISNWKGLKSINAYAFFWSIGSYVSTENNMNSFNDLVNEIISKCNPEWNHVNAKLFESEIDIKSNRLLTFQRNTNNLTNKDWIIIDYQYQANFIKLCIDNSMPCLVYGDLGIGKTNLIEKILVNKYDFTKLNNTEPNDYVYEILLKQAQFYRNKKYTSINGYKTNYIFFIDDLNVSFSSESNGSASMELMRLLFETKSLFNKDDQLLTPFNDMNFMLTCSYPRNTSNFKPLNEQLLKHVIPIHLNPNPISLLEGVYSLQVQNWLEEFPTASVQYPRELAQSIIKSLGEIYLLVKDHLKPIPKKPHYLFNFKDISKVVQGIQLLASKSKVVPVKLAKKSKDSQDQVLQQTITIIKLLAHELMRVFLDRVNDLNDEKWFKYVLARILEKNFCYPTDTELEEIGDGIYNKTEYMDDDYNYMYNQDKSLKKVVTFKVGLTLDRNFQPFKGALISKEQLGINDPEQFLNILFSKLIIRQPNLGSQKSLSTIERSTYLESNMSDLMNAATSSLDLYEKNKNLRMNFFFHEEAIKHLARLTRVYCMTRGHAILISQQYGLGRTNSVRLSAFLSKMKYFEARVTQDNEKSEKYLRAVLRQCCLIAGIKGSNCIIYIKMEYYPHKILENLISFIKTGIYPELFTEQEIWNIANEISPGISSTKRVERTLLVYNNFLNLIQERVHLIISLPSGLSEHDLTDLFKRHSSLYTDFYVDIYKPLNFEILNSIARYYLALQIEENKARKLSRKYNRFEDDEDNLSLKEIQIFSTVMVDLHLTAVESYINTYKPSLSRLSLPKPFNVSMFKQLSICFLIYMKRIKEQENFKIEKFDRVFDKINQVNEKIKTYDTLRNNLKKNIDDLEKVVEAWDEKISKQKDAFQIAVNECRKEEALVDEMSQALEKLKQDVMKDVNEFNKSFTPQYELAVKAIESLSETSFSELKSFRSPPQQVLSVVDALCVMFGKPTGWESGKLLLLRKGFFDDLVFYDKKNVPNEVFAYLEELCKSPDFLGVTIKTGSVAAASFCEWIRAVYEFSKFERTVGQKHKELKEFEELYNHRLTILGEKRLNSEKICQILEGYCSQRVSVLKDIKKIHLEMQKINEDEKKAEILLKLLDDDYKNWKSQYNNALNLINTYKLDALMTSAYVCYMGIFDSNKRKIIFNKWKEAISKTKSKESINLSLRETFDLKEILINSFYYKNLIVQLNKLGLKDEHFIHNALILREFCSLPTTMSWPLIFDPENYSLRINCLLQESIDSLKNTLNAEFINSTPITATSGPLKNQGSVFAPMRDNNSDEIPVNESTVAENPSNNALNETFTSINYEQNSLINQSMIMSTYESIQPNIARVESLPPYSVQSSRLSHSRKSVTSHMSERSSIWEASTFYSRSQTVQTVYHTKSGRPLLESLQASFEAEVNLPSIETDLNIMPKDNLCILDASDCDLEYKLLNAAVHGLAVFLKNSERYPLKSRIVEILLERDYFYNSNINKEYLKFGDEEIFISPGFKLILHVNTPMLAQTKSKNNFLFHRMTSQLNAAHYCVDLTPSNNFISEDFLNTIMDMEKPGYINQMILADKIFFESEFNIVNRQ